jgi:hypothetical protein
MAKDAFRFGLVKMFGKLLDIFKTDKEFKKFTFDGQTIVLEDILEIRPEWRKEMQDLISGGKLNVGPWYVMPDEFLVSGEAIIRNLLIGRQISSSFSAAPWPVAYVCDIFGHFGQLPQIMSGFGFKGIVAWRGIPYNAEAFLLWESPDGTKMPLLHLMPRNGYGSFSMEVRGLKDIPMDEEKFKARLKEWFEDCKKFYGDSIVLTDALDHVEPNHDTVKMLNWIQECYPDSEIIHDDFTRLFADEYQNREKLPVVKNELIHPIEPVRNGGCQISSTLSSRYDIKQANDRCENTLENEIEPMLAAAAVNGDTENLPFLNHAWKHLIQNHAHDSICGCSPDIVHRHMLPRFEEVMTIANEIKREHIWQDFERITGKMRWDVLHSDFHDDREKSLAYCDEEGNYTLRIYNPLPWQIKKVSKFEIAFPAAKPYKTQHATHPFSPESTYTFEIFDEKNNKIDYKIDKIVRSEHRTLAIGTSRVFNVYDTVAALDLRPSGWTEYKIRPVDHPVRNLRSLLNGRRSGSNGIISLKINDNGTFDITDLRSNVTYAGQNDYRWHRDIGDGWGFVEPVGGEITTGGYLKSIRIVHDSSERAEFEIVRAFDIPAEMIFKGGVYQDFKGFFASDKIITQEIKTFVALDRCSDALQIRTEIDNKLKDIRLQLVVPTDIAGNYFANQQFTTVYRQAGRIAALESESYQEPESPDKNFEGIIGKRNEAGGLVFIGREGLHECGCLAENEGDLTITLYRSFRRTVMRDGEVEGQLNKKLTFAYLLKCLTPKCTMTELNHLRKELQILPAITHLVPGHLIQEHTDESFMQLDGDLTFSALKTADNGTGKTLILRLYNPEKESRNAVIRFAIPFKAAELCRIDETILHPIASDNAGQLTVNAAPAQIITIKFTF